MIEPQYCQLPETNKRETLPYYEYYLGEKDEQNRRHGVGQNCWTGPESIDWHHGHFLRDTMHGPGEYRSRYKRKPGLFLTYEGRLYVNRMHGYGVMSYPDGKVFTGLFNNDIRYGPGIESFADTTANVGLWRGTSLIRLAWRPLPAVAPEVAAWTGGRTMVEPHRAVLQTAFRTIDKVNKAVEYLKKHGSDPVSATGNWTRLYPKHCTDIDSRLCHVELFDYEYYNGKVYSLKECNSPRIDEDLEKESENSLEHSGAYYAWNNDPLTIDMMKHSFKHEKQRKEVHIDLGAVLSGPRTQFKPPAMHELDCRTLLMACYLGHVSTTTSMINEQGLDPNVTDVLGNSALMYAACGDQVVLITFLCDGGARVNSANDSCCTPLAVALIRLLCASRDVPSSGMMQAFLPPATGPANSEPPTILEWNINRETLSEPPKNTLGKVPSKITKTNMKVKSLTSFKDLPSPSKKNMDMLDENDFNTKLYRDVNNEYIIKVTDSLEPVSQPVTYLFELNNMINEINEELAKLAQPEKKDPKSKASKVLKEPTKPSKEAIWPSSQKDEDVSTMTSAEIRKAETCNRIKLTILTLLENGAKPSLVRCPQPALVMAILAGVPDLVDQLIHYGADVNEVYPQLTNLLLFGADPLIACESEGVKYENLFVMVRKALAEMNPSGSKLTASPSPKKLEAKASLTKGKKPDPKKVDMLASDDIANLKQAVDLMTECSRIIYIRWLQTQLAKDIIQAIDRHRHRHWSMIIKECKNKKASGLWITAQRCLEIWGRLKTTRRKVYQDRAVLWRLLCIAHFFHLRSVTKYGFDKVTTAEKNEAESYASDILKENKKSPMVPLQRYVQPELFVKADAKFNVCFECFLPLTENRILCYSCKLVSFCNMDCLKESIEKSNGHACNDYLILKYFPEPPETVLEDEPMPNQPSVIK
ncbi:ankyrin repeat and MYND domain-containing protein 1-like isoform X2 [Leguminivora glycinivorella]|uniref:ankyrin repeat and MYND domain-containing protein 1-like isoform X2 n=1 Tax=Leguminivora glycinivorella TaxID=1035111 RepID=UPI00200CA446|nr:ankyrin repeat and MYND domain-containing protein 1-like isoform X2 [Leguminivora glycinivorella]